MTISLLLFDLGGVLVENAGFARLNQLLPRPLDDCAIRERWLGSSSVRRFELGELGPGAFAERFIAEWEIPLPAETFLEEFVSWPKGLYPGALELIRSLRRKYRVACLSNSNMAHWQRFESFTGEFDVALSSHLLGSIKPDADAFVRALCACGSEAENTCFFDDSIANVRAARSVGIDAVQVDGLPALRRALRARGLG